MTGEPLTTLHEIAKAARSDIEYVVLHEDAEGSWQMMGRCTAKTPPDAIEKMIADGDPGPTDWVAIAARYWSPDSYEVKVERSLVPKAAKSGG